MLPPALPSKRAIACEAGAVACSSVKNQHPPIFNFRACLMVFRHSGSEDDYDDDSSSTLDSNSPRNSVSDDTGGRGGPSDSSSQGERGIEMSGRQKRHQHQQYQRSVNDVEVGSASPMRMQPETAAVGVVRVHRVGGGYHLLDSIIDEVIGIFFFVMVRGFRVHHILCVCVNIFSCCRFEPLMGNVFYKYQGRGVVGMLRRKKTSTTSKYKIQERELAEFNHSTLSPHWQYSRSSSNSSEKPAGSTSHQAVAMA